MTADVVGVLAEALAQHRGGTNHSGDWECSCGKEGPEKSHDAHVASVVAALPNIAIIELPECAWCGQFIEQGFEHVELPGEDENGVRECHYVAESRADEAKS